MSDICLRDLASPDDVDLFDLTTCTAATVDAFAGIPLARRSVLAHRAFTAGIRAHPSLAYTVDRRGLRAVDDDLLDLL